MSCIPTKIYSRNKEINSFLLFAYMYIICEEKSESLGTQREIWPQQINPVKRSSQFVPKIKQSVFLEETPWLKNIIPRYLMVNCSRNPACSNSFPVLKVHTVIIFKEKVELLKKQLLKIKLPSIKIIHFIKSYLIKSLPYNKYQKKICGEATECK